MMWHLKGASSKLPAPGGLAMTIIICIAGAVVGLIIALVSNWLILPMVL